MAFEGYDRNLMYSVLINNTEIDSKCISELTDKGLIGSYKELFEYICGGLKEEGLTGRTFVRLNEAKSMPDKIKEIYRRYEEIISKCGITIIPDDSGSYPGIWKDLPGMPKVIYGRGDISSLKKVDDNGSVSVVGSRNPGRYSLYATGDFVSKIASKDVVIVSGLAIGIDRAAHEAAMRALGTTIAVLPSGCDEVYPLQNRDLFERITGGGGMVLSEMPPLSGVRKQYFPSRNRLISALSDCCLIMEAGEFSGTLHTASFAAYQGRDVFVLPNNIYADNCIGGLRLINDGASILLSVDDVIDSVTSRLLYRKADKMVLNDKEEKRKLIENIRAKVSKDCSGVSDEEIAMLVKDELEVRDLTADELSKRLGIPFFLLSQVLSDMELCGSICREKGKFALTISL